jgi:hypothetical protein
VLHLGDDRVEGVVVVVLLLLSPVHHGSGARGGGFGDPRVELEAAVVATAALGREARGMGGEEENQEEGDDAEEQHNALRLPPQWPRRRHRRRENGRRKGASKKEQFAGQRFDLCPGAIWTSNQLTAGRSPLRGDVESNDRTNPCQSENFFSLTWAYLLYMIS